MTFLNPILAMVGLGCVAVPIIIHILMRRRRRPVPWGAMRFLLEAYRRQRRRMNLEQILLLASRCLLIALLALALGKPILGAAGLLAAGGPKTVYLLIDNSVAGGAGADASGSGGAIEKHRAAALETVGALDRARGDRVGVIFLASPVEAAVLPPSSELAGVSDIIRQARPTASRADIPSALTRLREELTRKENADQAAQVVVLSDFRAGSADTQSAVQALGLPAGRVTFAATKPVQTPAPNVTISGMEPARGVLLASGDGGDASTSVTVSLVRSGGPLEPAVSTVTLRTRSADGGDEAQPDGEAAATVAWSAGQASAQAFLSITPRAPARPGVPVVLSASIDRDALGADDLFLRPIETRERLDVAIITPGEVGVRGGIAAFRSADWMALALSPAADLTLRRRQSGEVRVQTVDPAQGIAPGAGSGADRGSRGAGVLRGMDAVLIPSPDVLDATAWKAVREACAEGALILVTPPVGPESHTWTDAFLSSLDLPWRISREARVPRTPLELARDRAILPGADMLSVIASELPSLVTGVSVARVLDVAAAPDAMEPILKLADGSPLLVRRCPAAAPRHGAVHGGGPGDYLDQSPRDAADGAADAGDCPSGRGPLGGFAGRAGGRDAGSAPRGGGARAGGCRRRSFHRSRVGLGRAAAADPRDGPVARAGRRRRDHRRGGVQCRSGRV
jgi:hypothetical protein